MNKASICAGNASIRNSGDALNICDRYHKYEKRVTTGGNQDNIGQMFIGKENRERGQGYTQAQLEKRPPIAANKKPRTISARGFATPPDPKF